MTGTQAPAILAEHLSRSFGGLSAVDRSQP
jgi:hypothetical protein